MSRKHNKIVKEDTALKPQIDEKKKFPWTKFAFKIVFLLSVIAAVVYYTDKKEYFVGDQTNNHSQRKWRSFYRFSEQGKNADIIVMGNSHASAGVEPYIVSVNTGSYCFILNTPGSGSTDLYYNLREVLKYSKPKLIIIEASCLVGNSIGVEWAKIQSIESKKGFWNRLTLIPHYLPSDQWIKAVSPTIRNHSFLLKDRERIHFNAQNVGIEKNPDRQPLDLGRFSHGSNFLKDSVLNLYNTKGSPFTSKDYYITDETRSYIHKTYDLCEKNNIKLMFLTVPMYYKTYENYDTLKNIETEFIAELPNTRWLDLQQHYDTTFYTVQAFNNEYGNAQHNTYFGMVLNTYRLCDFIQQNYTDILPNRNKEKAWLLDFYNVPHFLYNQMMPIGMPNCYLVAKNIAINGVPIRELLVQNAKNYSQLILKTENIAGLPNTLKVVLKVKDHSQPVTIEVITPKDLLPPQYKVYVANIVKDITIEQIIAIAL